MRKFTAGAVVLVGAVGIATGTAGAEPVPDRAPVQVHTIPDHWSAQLNGGQFTVSRDGGSAVLDAREGTFRIVDGSVLVDDGHGAVVGSLPLSYRKDNLVYPIAVQIGAHSVRMTPALTGGTPAPNPITRTDLAHGHAVTNGATQGDPVSESFTPRDQQELSAFSTRAWLASFTGTVVGAILGGVVGCGAGALAGGLSTAVTTLFAGVLPGVIVGCIAGVALVGAVGGLLGTILVAGPIGLWAAYQYFSTILTPCTTPGTYCQDPAAPPAPPK